LDRQKVQKRDKTSIGGGPPKGQSKWPPIRSANNPLLQIFSLDKPKKAKA
jgi:hypothetical protein